MYNSNEYTPGEKYLKEYIVNNSNGEHCVRIPDAFEALKIERKCLIEHICKWLDEHLPFGEVDFDYRNEIIEDFKQAMLEE